MALRSLHRTSAIVVAAFAFIHLANHLAALRSVQSHEAFMTVARAVYRQPLLEAVLLFCVIFQVASGLWLFVRGWPARRGALPWIQALSGAYLALFLLVHVSAILFGRGALDLDTNFYFAAAGFHVPPYPNLFFPYYFLAVLALFIHLGCAAYWRVQPATRGGKVAVVALPALVGAGVALLIVLSLAGALQPVDVPAKYKATYADANG